MFKHKAQDGTRNLCGKKVSDLRKEILPKVSQRQLATLMQLKGIDMDKTAIRRIENGERYVTDIELKALSEIFDISLEFLIG
ncbi:MAG: helix-turn-helix domain-containing protein [Defluviitaleaceae bacterium]|nr:helix-turn-helix domain-containing protein [Defluviitaleaceae bacterium]